MSRGMLVRRMSHVSFAVRDLERSLAFYRDVLGLAPIARPDLGIPGAWLSAGDVAVHLIVVPPEVDAGTPVGSLTPLANHAAFATGDHEAAVEALRAHGIEVLDGGTAMGQLWVRDPDGNVIELIAESAR